MKASDLATPLWEHQREACRAAYTRSGTLLDAWMGTGKTLIALALFHHWDTKRVLVTAPKSVCRVWARELAEHSTVDWEIVVLHEGSVADKRKRAQQALEAGLHSGRPVMIVINHESVWREPFRQLAMEVAWGCVVVDESHRIKSPGGKLSRFCGELAKRTPRRLALTGTPLPHSPMDLYAQARFVDRTVFGASAHRFRSRYAVMGGYGNHQIVNWRNMEDYREKMRSFTFHVSRDVEALRDLPPEVDETRLCQLEPAAQKTYSELEKDFFTLVEKGEVTVSNALSKLLRLQQLTGGWLPLDGQDRAERISRAKDGLLYDTLLDVKPPAVVFCRFQRDLDIALEIGRNLGLKVAELSGRSKDALDDEGRLEASVELAAVQIQAGGVGVDLSRASVAIYYSLGFSLGDYLQSRSRLHRPGQQGDHVVYVHLACENTVDEKVIHALRQREQVIEKIVRGT